MNIKVGDKVRHTSFSGKELEGTITCIEVCKLGSKEGRSIQEWDEKKHPEVICTLDNGHWCYGSQIKQIVV